MNTRTNALAVALGIALCLLATTAPAEVLYDSQGFENFADGNVHGQDGWVSSSGTTVRMAVKNPYWGLNPWTNGNDYSLPSGAAGAVLQQTSHSQTNAYYASRDVAGATSSDIVQFSMTLYYNAWMRTDNYNRRVDVEIYEKDATTGNRLRDIYLIYQGNPSVNGGQDWDVQIPSVYNPAGNIGTIKLSDAFGEYIKRCNKTDIVITADYATRKWWLDVSVQGWDHDGTDFVNPQTLVWDDYGYGTGFAGLDMDAVTNGTGQFEQFAYKVQPPSTSTNTTYNQISLDNLVIETIPEPATLSLLGLGGLAVLRRRRR